jgi:hypothetical protein
MYRFDRHGPKRSVAKYTQPSSKDPALDRMVVKVPGRMNRKLAQVPSVMCAIQTADGLSARNQHEEPGKVVYHVLR